MSYDITLRAFVIIILITNNTVYAFILELNDINEGINSIITTKTPMTTTATETTTKYTQSNNFFII